MVDIKTTPEITCIDSDMPKKPYLAQLIPQHWLLVFCGFQLILWTLFPWLVRNNLVYDTMESLVWGQQWQWGYDKHPPFTAWVTALFGKLTTPPDLAIYFLAQLCVVVTYLSVWRLAKEFLNHRAAVLSVIMLCGVLFYSNRVERVTPDTMQSPIWAMLALTIFLAAHRNSLFYWSLSGILVGIGFLTKYQIAVFLAPLTIPFLFTQQGRHSLRAPGPWLAILIALAVISPHIHWMNLHDFPAFQYLNDHYITNNNETPVSWLNYLKHPFDFVLSNLGNVILLVFIGWPLLKLPCRTIDQTSTSPDPTLQFNSLYLYSIALGPLLVTILFGLINGEPLVPRWATPYFAWLPLLILYQFNREIDARSFVKVVINCFIVALLILGLRTSYIYFKPYYKDDYWRADEYTPSKQTLKKAEELWNEHFSYPLPFIGGDHYHVISIAANSTSKTVPYSNLSHVASPWMTDQDFRNNGGIIVNQINNQTTWIREKIKKEYPESVYLGTFSFRPLIPGDIENAIHSDVEFFLLKPKEK